MDGEDTQKVRRVVHAEVKAVKRLQWWLWLAFSIAAAGGGTIIYLNTTYAARADVTTITSKVETIGASLTEHIRVEGERQTAIEVRGIRTEEDYHAMIDQLRDIAKTVGAHVMPLPLHRTPTPPARSVP